MKSAFFIIGAALLLLLSGCSTQKITGNAVKEADNIREVNVKAFRFGYDPDVINAKKGEKLRININNVDVPHGMIFRELGISGTDSLEFTADKTGEFVWNCFTPCGNKEGHLGMKGKIVVR